MPFNVTHFLQQLIQIPSVNPDDNPGTDKVGEQAMADFLQPWLEQRGYKVWQDEVQAGRPNLIARAPGDDLRPRILLCPHLDTVGVGNMTVDPFGGEILDGKIWGRGTSDTKGSIAAMLAGIDANVDKIADLPIAVDFAAFMGEESSQYGSKDFANKYADDYVFAIAGEPTMLDIVQCTKGSAWFKLIATGKAAHSSQPQLGENAILKLADALSQLQETLNSKLATFTHPVLGHSTINIGIIEGGSRANIVPDYAAATVDIRVTPALHQSGGALALVQQTIDQLNLDVSIEPQNDNPPMECPADDPYIARIQSSHPESKLVGAPWFSDAGHLAAAGIPSICLGPGSIDQAHTKDEFIQIDHLEAGAAFFSKFIADLA